MPDDRFAVEVVQGVPVVTVPEEIDITNADGLRSALLEAASNGHGTLVVDMTRTRFCDSSALHTMIAAHKRAQAEDREVRLVITAAPVLRVFALTSMDRVIPNFTTLAEALTSAAATATGRSRRRTEGIVLAEVQPVQPAASR
jgi:anti-sigma B factor antagonist